MREKKPIIMDYGTASHAACDIGERQCQRRLLSGFQVGFRLESFLHRVMRGYPARKAFVHDFENSPRSEPSSLPDGIVANLVFLRVFLFA